MATEGIKSVSGDAQAVQRPAKTEPIKPAQQVSNDNGPSHAPLDEVEISQEARKIYDVVLGRVAPNVEIIVAQDGSWVIRQTISTRA